MRKTLRLVLAVALIGCSPATPPPPELPSDPLPSWNAGPAKEAVLDFVDRVSDEAHPDFRPAQDRVAVFDNDGTLWAEKPFYFQLAYALDRVRAMAPEHPDWRDQAPLRAVIDGDEEAMATFGLPELMTIIAVTHAGMNAEEFRATARSWLDTAQHPRFERLYSELAYAPMLELLEYLRANGFRTWIVSGGGVEFLRVFAEEVYGIPPEQVVGSSMEVEYRSSADVPAIVRLPHVASINDRDVKPLNINLHIGRRPILAFGNSDGDFEMLEYTTAGDGARLGLLLHHDDAEREWAYDRDSHIGRLDRGLTEGPDRGWVLVSMARDFGRVFSWQ